MNVFTVGKIYSKNFFISYLRVHIISLVYSFKSIADSHKTTVYDSSLYTTEYPSCTNHL